MTSPARIVLRHVMHITQRQSRGVFCAKENGFVSLTRVWCRLHPRSRFSCFTQHRPYGSCDTSFISNFDLVLFAIELAFGLKVLDALLQLFNFRLESRRLGSRFFKLRVPLSKEGLQAAHL